MTQDIAVDQLLSPISETAPAGSDLRYTTFYEEIMEARRSDDAVALGDWRHDVKSSDWEKVSKLCVAALSEKSKDLQISAWLSEALTVVDGFEGLDAGLRLIAGLIDRFWDCIYPLSDDGDPEYRTAPFEFLNEKVALRVRQIPVTDKSVTPGYSWLKWRESRVVGSDADTRNGFGDVDEDKKSWREERIAENAVTAEEFDAAVAGSAGAFSRTLLDSLNRCQESLQLLADVVQEKFGPSAPSLAELAEVIGGCSVLVRRIYAEQPVPEQAEIAPAALPQLGSLAAAPPAQAPAEPGCSAWGDAVALLEAGQLQDALGMLLDTSNGSGSVRDRNRVRLLMAKLCLKAGRSDLARPIVEELHEVIERLQLERWESPVWIAEVLEAYYQCLQAGDLPDDDQSLSRALFRRICSLDVTKAMPYRI